ncbi:hypothetical protein ACHAAC_05295 [Aeromicrobium sp. CF4.19]|uniref:hypothetical protein n=1 Tax=Aeromicrobium sp. CF4.19 TaxID=3373082 RepID=UPI003EE65EC4
MPKSRIAAIAVVVVLVAAAGVLGLRSWVGIEEGESLTGDDALPALTPTETPSPDATPEPSASPSPSASPTPTPSESDDESDETAGAVSPSGIASDIQSRLNRSGPATSVRCPQAVSPEVGTSFSCSVAFAEAPGQTVADATVDIVGSGLRYVWRSAPR